MEPGPPQRPEPAGASPGARTRRRVLVARGVAMLADLVQLVLSPLVLAGALSPWEDAIDVTVAALLIWLVGWHWAFLPAFVSELVPGLDLFPTWTAAVLFATRGRHGKPAH